MIFNEQWLFFYIYSSVWLGFYFLILRFYLSLLHLLGRLLEFILILLILRTFILFLRIITDLLDHLLLLVLPNRLVSFPVATLF